MAGLDRDARPAVSDRTSDGLARIGRYWLLYFRDAQQLVCFSIDRHARRTPARRLDRAVGRRSRFPAASLGAIATDSDGHHRLVLALHGGFVGLYFGAARVCAVTDERLKQAVR